MSAKIVTIPADLNFDKSWIDVGDVTDLGGGQLAISNPDTDEVKGVLGESLDEVGGLCASDMVNRWALFCPNGEAPYDLGEFAGYNHQALPCVRYSATSGNAQKQYDSVAGDAKFPVSLSLLIGEKYPLHSGSNTSWAEIAVKVTIGAVTQWAELSLPASNNISLWFHTSNFGAETINASISAYYVDDPSGISLVGYKDGHYKGLLIEDDSITFAVNCAAIDPSLYCNFDYTIGWDASKKWVSVGGFTPSGYTYTLTAWSASLGSINQDFGSYAEVGLVNDGGTPNCGTFQIGITASYAGMISVFQLVTISIRNNALSLD